MNEEEFKTLVTLYFEIPESTKHNACQELLDLLSSNIIHKYEEKEQRKKIMRKVLKDSLAHQEKVENYELCGIIQDCLKLLDEY